MNPPIVEVHDSARAVPHSHAVVEVVGGEAVEVEHGPALESHPHVAARLDARDVAVAHHESPAEVNLALQVRDLDPEDLDGPRQGDELHDKTNPDRARRRAEELEVRRSAAVAAAKS